MTQKQLQKEIKYEPNVITVFTRSIYESHIAEIDGSVALVMMVEGASESDIVRRVQEEIVPSLKKNHGEDAIEEVQTIRLLAPVRLLRNYLPAVNMEAGMMKPGWSADAIFVA